MFLQRGEGKKRGCKYTLVHAVCVPRRGTMGLMGASRGSWKGICVYKDAQICAHGPVWAPTEGGTQRGISRSLAPRQHPWVPQKAMLVALLAAGRAGAPPGGTFHAIVPPALQGHPGRGREKSHGPPEPTIRVLLFCRSGTNILSCCCSGWEWGKGRGGRGLVPTPRPRDRD